MYLYEDYSEMYRLVPETLNVLIHLISHVGVQEALQNEFDQKGLLTSLTSLSPKLVLHPTSLFPK